MKRIFVGVPLHFFTPPQFIACWTNFVVNRQLGYLSLDPGPGSVNQARNRITAEFLRSDATHLLFIDSDLMFTPEQVDRLLSHDVPIVGGLYPIKQEGPLKFCFNTLEDHPKTRADGLHPCRHVGTGFMLIERSVVQAIWDKSPEFIDRLVNETCHQVWRDYVLDWEYLTEDWWFCTFAKKLGFDVFADSQVQLIHISSNVQFPLRSQIAAANKQGAA